MRPARFRNFLAIDWSGAVGARQPGIAIALAAAEGGPPVLVDPGRGWSREEVLALLRDDLPAETLVGLDLGIGLPFADCGAFFPGHPDSPRSAEALWRLVEAVCADDPGLAASSFVHHPEFAPYFRRQPQGEGPRFRCDGAGHGRGRFRVTERVQEAMGCRPYSNFNLVGAAQVGKSSLTGMRLLHRLRGVLPVWPVDPLPAHGSLIVEIYTTIAARAAGRSAAASKIRTWESLDDALAALGCMPIGGAGPIRDHASDALLAAAWLRRVASDASLWSPSGLASVRATEGWTFGAA
jgi:hypothetical protein